MLLPPLMLFPLFIEFCIDMVEPKGIFSDTLPI
jgi:hypothetical protein